MTTPIRAGLIAVAAVTVGIGLTACGSDTATEDSATTSTTTTTTSGAETTTSEAPPTSTEAAGAAMTIADYVKENNIVETPVHRGDAGAPTVDLPFPPGWEDMGAKAPEWAYGGILFTGDPAAAQDPPTIIAILSKLTGDVDPAKILEYAPGELQNLPDYEGPDTGQPSNLSGFDAVQLGGFYTRDGASRMIAQKTVVIPAPDGVYVLQLNADGPEAQSYPLMEATSVIDDQAKITP
ncbi:LpqN/LpqT family lipoprotein [Mycobacterium sp. Y57]|uniref:LpqN/LpqT family lipoprotein n=1 Tax=Mycolicibacterium xanthum TaxID=2796469 RepID=UPI001C84A3E4|nr:LpqN/LpqT family lipoprotein [Mycolicibacterium xanthum]MBX7434718.1 LpqN/LpqT family lipoprotein [Mycolicibacterium xanthum]